MVSRCVMRGAALPFVLVLSVVLLSLTLLGLQAQRQFMRSEQLLFSKEQQADQLLQILQHQQGIGWWLAHWAPNEMELSRFCERYHITENTGMCLRGQEQEAQVWWLWNLAANEALLSEQDMGSLIVVVKPEKPGLPVWARRFYLLRQEGESEWRVAQSSVAQLRHPVIHHWRYKEAALWWNEVSL